MKLEIVDKDKTSQCEEYRYEEVSEECRNHDTVNAVREVVLPSMILIYNWHEKHPNDPIEVDYSRNDND